MPAVAQITENDASREAWNAIAQAESALANLLRQSERLHRAGIEHDRHSCLVCFGSR
jgi:hypothetical protein